MYVGDDGFALFQVRCSEAVDRQHDERRTDETESNSEAKTKVTMGKSSMIISNIYIIISIQHKSIENMSY